MTQETLTHHMIDSETSLEYELEKFRIRFPYTKVRVEDSYMTYNCVHSKYAESMLREAKNLITGMGLNLKAETETCCLRSTLIISEA